MSPASDMDNEAWTICKRLGPTPHHFSLQDLATTVAKAAGCDDLRVYRHDFEGGEIYGLAVSDGRHIAILVRNDLLLPQFEWVVCHELVHILRGDITAGYVHACGRDPFNKTPEEAAIDRLGHALLKLCSMSASNNKNSLDSFFRSMGNAEV